MREKIFFILFIFLSMSSILCAQVWDEPMELGIYCGDGEIAYDSDNMTYLVLIRDHIYLHFIKSADGGATWSETMQLGHLSRFSGSPDIAIDSNNEIYVVYKWSYFWRVDEELFFVKSTDRGETWTEPIQIAFTPYCSTRSNILIDSNDVIHVIWNDVIYGTQEPYESMGAFHISSEDGGETWSDPVQIENAYEKQDALIDSENNIYVFGRPMPGANDIYCFKSEDGGENWTHSFAGTWFFPAAAVDRNDTLHLVSGNYGDTLFYQCSLDRGETWSEPRPIAAITPTDESSKDIAVDNMNNIIVAYQNTCGENNEIYYIKSPNSGITWIREWKLTETLEESIHPKLFIDPNYIIHLLWDECVPEVYSQAFYIRGFLRGKNVK
jgi:hypothetical protein